MAGPRVLVTRPQPMADALAVVLRAARCEPVVCPMLRFESWGDGIATRVQLRLQQADARVVFVSPAAVQYGLGVRKDVFQSASARVLAVGPGTAAALQAAGIARVICPEHARPGSEALLDLPEMQAVRGEPVVLVQGDRPRGLLQRVLAERGAVVEEITCYRSLGPAISSSEFIALWINEPFDIVLLTSVGAFTAVADLLGAASRDAAETAFVAVSERVASAARNAGWNGPFVVANSADTDSVVAATVALAKRIGRMA